MKAYGFSLIIGGVVTYFWSLLLHFMIQKQRKPKDSIGDRIIWIPIFLGLVERSLYTILIANNISGSAGFIGAWITIKAVGGWATFSKDGSTYGRSLFGVGLLGSAMSALFGVAGGLMAQH